MPASFSDLHGRQRESPPHRLLPPNLIAPLFRHVRYRPAVDPIAFAVVRGEAQRGTPPYALSFRRM